MSGIDNPSGQYPKLWYDFIPDPPIVEDGMLQNPVIEDIGSILRLRFKPQADSILVAGRSFILYDIEDPNARIAPDYYVVFDVDAQTIIKQNGYLVWQWGKPPNFILEIATESTALDDLTTKRDIYAQIGAPEYWRFDPTGGELYGQPLTGERLVDGKYEPYPIRTDASGDIWARSEALNMDFYRRGDRFWVKDSATGKWLNFLEAERAAHEKSKADRLTFQAEVETYNRERPRLSAEAEARELRAEIDRLRQSK